MDRITITGSSNISEIGYDYESMTLEIKFTSGGIYQYWPITRAGYEQFSNAESKGSYFHKNIRGAKGVDYKKVDELGATI